MRRGMDGDKITGVNVDKSKVVVQLHRIEGQLRGIASMIESDRGMVSTVQQLMAAQSSLKRLTGNYIQLFMQQKEGKVELTPEQLEYILKLIQ